MGVNKTYLFRLFALAMLFYCHMPSLCAQTKSSTIVVEKPAQKKERYTVAVLTPMYLDSFDLAKNLANIPDFALPGIEFYKGIQMAADTLNRAGIKVDVHVYDTRSKYLSLARLIETKKFDSVDCIIGNVSGSEIQQLAAFCKSKEIMLISAVSPNDGEQEANPYFVLLQPRLQTHMQKLRKQINSKHTVDNIIFCKRDGNNAENNAWNYFNKEVSTSSEATKSINIKGDVLTVAMLAPKLDKQRTNVIVLAVLGTDAAEQNLQVIQEFRMQGYDIVVYGMPTWRDMEILKNTELIGDMHVYITTAYTLEDLRDEQKYVQNTFKTEMGSEPSNIVFKGFDALYFFSHLLNANGKPMAKYLSKNNKHFCTPYSIAPAYDNEVFKYYENKFLYLAHFHNGTVKHE
jgi:ABC-type branched-subunit amino acid transport system substrate-binding protein